MRSRFAPTLRACWPQLAVACLLALTIAGASHAQDVWPNRTVRLIVSSSPAGGTDVFARLIANALAQSLGQQFIVDNRPGGNGTIAAEAVARAAPDGYTFLVSASPSIVVVPALFRKQNYDVERDLAPVTRGVLSPLVLCVVPGSPHRTLADLVALARREDARVPYGSAGAASMTHLGVRLLEEAASVRFLHVPYKGVGPAIQDLFGGQVQFVLTDLAAAVSHLRSGKLRALAVMPKTNLLPDTPSFAVAGFAVQEVSAAFALVAPAGTPAPVMQRLSAELMKAMRGTELAARLDTLGFLPVIDTPDEAAKRLRDERNMWIAFVRRTGMTVEH